MSSKLQQPRLSRSKRQASKQSLVSKINQFKQFLVEIDCLKNLPIKVKGLEPKIVEELEVNKYKINEFSSYFQTFQMKFAEKCQKKWSKRDKAMLLWIIVRYIQYHGKKSIHDLQDDDFQRIYEITGISKKLVIQEISQILSLKTSKNPFTKEEKNVLMHLVQKYENPKEIQWNIVAQDFNNSFQDSYMLRNIKSLKQVYFNHLNPNLNKQSWQPEEDCRLIEIIARVGKKWQQAANEMQTRNQCQVKNEFHKLIREQMQQNRIPQSRNIDFESQINLLLKYKVKLEKLISEGGQYYPENQQQQLNQSSYESDQQEENYEKNYQNEDEYSNQDVDTQPYYSSESPSFQSQIPEYQQQQYYVPQQQCYYQQQSNNYYSVVSEPNSIQVSPNGEQVNMNQNMEDNFEMYNQQPQMNSSSGEYCERYYNLDNEDNRILDVQNSVPYQQEMMVKQEEGFDSIYQKLSENNSMEQLVKINEESPIVQKENDEDIFF